MGENGFSEGYAVGVSQNSNGFGNGMWGSDWIWIILLLALFGGNWGGNGYGAGNGGGIVNGYALATDFATLERKLDGVNNGLCDGFYSTNMNIANSTAALQNTLCQGFSGINQNLVTQGYENRLATQGIMAQLADCCCDIKGGIKDVQYTNTMGVNQLDRRISDCCCDLEKMNMQTRFDAQQTACTTLQAIDRVGDRVIDYLSAQRAADLRDENFALKLAASQAQQNNFLIDRLNPNPCPKPAYVVQPPQQVTFPTNCCGTVNYAGYNNNCGCGCGCN